MDPLTMMGMAKGAMSLFGGGGGGGGAGGGFSAASGPATSGGPITFGNVNVGGIASPIASADNGAPLPPYQSAGPVYGVTTSPGMDVMKFAGLGLIGVAAVLLLKNKKG